MLIHIIVIGFMPFILIILSIYLILTTKKVVIDEKENRDKTGVNMQESSYQGYAAYNQYYAHYYNQYYYNRGYYGRNR